MNQLIEAGLSGLASGLGVAILSGIVWLVLKASHAIFSEPMKEGTSQETDSKRRTLESLSGPIQRAKASQTQFQGLRQKGRRNTRCRNRLKIHLKRTERLQQV